MGSPVFDAGCRGVDLPGRGLLPADPAAAVAEIDRRRAVLDAEGAALMLLRGAVIRELVGDPALRGRIQAAAVVLGVSWTQVRCALAGDTVRRVRAVLEAVDVGWCERRAVRPVGYLAYVNLPSGVVARAGRVAASAVCALRAAGLVVTDEHGRAGDPAPVTALVLGRHVVVSVPVPPRHRGGV